MPTAPRFTVDADGKKRPVTESGIEPDHIGKVQVVRDAHLGMFDPDKPAATAESRSGGRRGIGNTLGSFVLGEVFATANPMAIDASAVSPVSFPGTKQIAKTRFRALTPIAKVGTAAAAAVAVAPAVETENWILCITEPGARGEVVTVTGRLMKTESVHVLQLTKALKLYVPDSRITLCPADVDDPASNMSSGTVVACAPGKTSFSIIFTPAVVPEKEGRDEA